MSASPIDAVIFDWDNTLVDSWDTIHAALHDTFVALGRDPWTPAETRARVRASARDAFPEIFGEDWREAGRIFTEAFEAQHIATLRALDGAEALLQCLKGAGIYTAVVSNKRGRFLRKEAAHLGWERYFDALIGAGDAQRDKPAVDPVELALKPGGLMPTSAVWFVGDTDIDMACAHASGCYPVLLRPVAPGEGEFGAAPPALHFPDCASLREVVAERRG